MSVKLRWRDLKGGIKSAYLDIYIPGQARIRENLNLTISKKDLNSKETKLLAEKIRDKRALEVNSLNHGEIPTIYGNTNFIKFFEDYISCYTKKDIRKLKYSLNKFKLFTEGKPISSKQLNEKLCLDFKNFLQSPEAGLSGQTPSDYWKMFKSVLKAAKSQKIIKENPAEEIKFTGAQKFEGQLRKQVLTSEELQKMANTKCESSDLKRAFIFACFTGLGTAEIRNLTWSKIKDNKIQLYREKSGEQVMNELHPTAILILGERKVDSDLIFKLSSEVAIGKALKKWVKASGIEKNISFYCARHTFATNLLLNGTNVKTVADAMGHSSTKHTIKYLNYVDSLKKEAILRLPEIKL